MYSLTKTNYSTESLLKIIRLHFGEDTIVEQLEELKDGYFNSAYFFALSENKKHVLKIAPLPGAPILQYEENIMKAEVKAMEIVRTGTTVPVPEIIFSDFSCKNMNSPYFIMTHIPGAPFDKLRDTMPTADQHVVEHQMGAFTRQINSIKGTAFGYFLEERGHFSRWRDAFDHMITILLADGKRMGTQLPIPYEKIQSTFASYYHLLDEVTTPRLVHWDIWDGNVFVDPDIPRVTGIIDFERAIWGDPLMEVYFGRPGHHAYLNAYGKPMLDTPEKRACQTLYNIYLALILVIEHDFRQYETTDVQTWGEDLLLKKWSELRSFEPLARTKR